MKKYNFIANVLMVVAFALLIIGLFLTLVIMNVGDQAFILLIQANAVMLSLGVVGAFMIYSKSDVATKIGHGFIVVCYVLALALALSVVFDAPEISIGAIVTLAAAVVCIVSYVFRIIDSIVAKNVKPDKAPTDLTALREWKALLDEHIITQQQFDAKRNELLGIKEEEVK